VHRRALFGSSAEGRSATDKASETDDDEWVAHDWMIQLVNATVGYGAIGRMGPTCARKGVEQKQHSDGSNDAEHDPIVAAD
jgi:hypothetical protein